MTAKPTRTNRAGRASVVRRGLDPGAGRSRTMVAAVSAMPGHGRRAAAPVLTRVSGDVGVDAEEREGQDAAQEDRRRQAAAGAAACRAASAGGSAGDADAARPATSGRASGRRPTVESPTTVSPAPSDEDDRQRQAPSRVRGEPVLGLAGGAARRRDRAERRRVSAPASAMSGSRPRKTNRQPKASPTVAGDRRADDAGQDPGGRERREHPRPEATPAALRPMAT